MSDNKVKGPDYAIASEIAAAFGKNLHYYLWFSGTLHGPYGFSNFVEDREIDLLEETRCCSGTRIRSYRAIALTSVMSKWYASCALLRLEKEKELEKRENLHVGGVDGISCQRLQV